MQDEQEFAPLVAKVAAACERGGWRVVTAESCTGGWVAKVLTDRPGSSVWFDRAFVSYSNQAKMAMLGVAASTLDAFGAVSREVVLEMAAGARERAGADFAIAISGIAGPGGGSADKPAGTVWFAWAGADGATAECRQFDGDRDRVRRCSVVFALEGLLAVPALADGRPAP